MLFHKKEDAGAFDFNQFWQDQEKDHQDVAQQTFAALKDDMESWLAAAEETVRYDHKIMFFGNGGSAADAQHIAAELSVKLSADRAPIAGLCLSLDPSALTACGNDYGFDQIFARQIRALGQSGDMAVGLSTSGNSKNVLAALQTAKDLNIKTAGLTGESGGKMAGLCDTLLKIPSQNTARIQEMHITLGHIFCGALERRLGLV